LTNPEVLRPSLTDLLPLKNPGFSPGVYNWLARAHRGLADDQIDYDVIEVKPGCGHLMGFAPLYVNRLLLALRLDNQCWAGVPLHCLLTHDAPSDGERTFVLFEDADVVADFWERYGVIGRCAADPRHEWPELNPMRLTVALPDGHMYRCRCGAAVRPTPDVLSWTPAELAFRTQP
jgi:hypothetical protein